MPASSKKSLTEQDIRDQHVTPALRGAGWDMDAAVRCDVQLTKGPILVRGRMVTRGESKRADYVLFHGSNLPIAIVETKDNQQPIGAGMPRGLAYASLIDVPFVYSSNGDGFLEHDRTVASVAAEREITLGAFPSPDALWRRYCAWRGIGADVEAVVTRGYWSDGGDEGDKVPRYYQRRAVNRAVEAVAKGQQRALLVMASGAGKTLTAFQIIWRLWKAGVKKRILFLAERNVLVEQAKSNEFRPFAGKMTQIEGLGVDPSFAIYLARYQAAPGVATGLFEQFAPGFFDLVVVDECQSGSPAADSAWRAVLDYFSSATQIGLTATPQATRYFGDAIDTYTLKQGIDDGFLAPHKVVRVGLGLGLNLRLDAAARREKRTELVARRVTEFLKGTDRYAKTIVFCDDEAHAERMRAALAGENADLASAHRKYILRITGDNPESKAQLRNFVDREERYPVVVTTSDLLSTGVDTQTCEVIVVDREIQSVTELAQIVGRGTRIREDCGKQYFTILDFGRSTQRFSDPEFDGHPVQVHTPGPGEPIVPPDEDADRGLPSSSGPSSAGVPSAGGGRAGAEYLVGGRVVVVVDESVRHPAEDGSLVIDSLRDYTRTAVRRAYPSLERFVESWSAGRKGAILEELTTHGVFFNELAREVGPDYSAFDLVCHVAFDKRPVTRRERAGRVRRREYFAKYDEAPKAVLEALLDAFAGEGVDDLENVDFIRRAQPVANLGSEGERMRRFGGREAYLAAVRELEGEIYELA